MAKTPKCSGCGELGHYKIQCRTTARTPIKRSTVRYSVKKVKVPTKEKKKPKTRSYYVKKLDQVFSEYIRRSKPPVCVTCGKHDDWKNLQNGHYYSRGKLPTRWHEDNCHVQCVGCNVFKSGNYTEYALYMLQSYGEDKLRELHTLANSTEKIPTSVIKDKIEEYRSKCLTL